jgi:hypothetical protein
VGNPIDAFIAAEHEQRGLKPRPEAAKEILLRRIYLDLIGLPPTAEELNTFLGDASTNAYEKVVDRLLASPQYGERWGRHWMDIWRYSDWAGWGQEVRDSQPHVWKWRDWIVESLNQDKGYDRMILEMIAGDEIAPEDERTVRATGYLVRNYKRYGREKWLQDTVDHVFQAFQGTTIGCARCHDHMYDPILQKEYYQVRAVFEPYSVRIDRVPGQPDVNKDGLARAFDATLDAKTFLFIRGDERTPEQPSLEPGVPEALGIRYPKVEPVKLPKSVIVPGKRDFVEREDLEASTQAIAQANAGLAAARANLAGAIGQSIFPKPLLAISRLHFPREIFHAFALAEMDRDIAQARHTSLLATIGAEHLEDAGKKDSLEGRAAAMGANGAQRHLALLEARRRYLVVVHDKYSCPEKARPPFDQMVNDAFYAQKAAEEKALLPSMVDFVKRPIPVYPITSTGRRLAFSKWLANRDKPAHRSCGHEPRLASAFRPGNRS